MEFERRGAETNQTIKDAKLHMEDHQIVGRTEYGLLLTLSGGLIALGANGSSVETIFIAGVGAVGLVKAVRNEIHIRQERRKILKLSTQFTTSATA